MFRPEDIMGYSDQVDRQLGIRRNSAPAMIYQDIDGMDMLQRTYGNRVVPTSYFSKKMDKNIQEISGFIKNVDQQLRENAESIKNLSRTPAGQKYASELRSNITALLNTKISALKLKSDLEVKKDKARKEDYKIHLDAIKITGGPAQPIDGVDFTNSNFLNRVMDSANESPKYNFNGTNPFSFNTTSKIDLSQVSAVDVTHAKNRLIEPDDKLTVEVRKHEEKQPINNSTMVTGNDVHVSNSAETQPEPHREEKPVSTVEIPEEAVEQPTDPVMDASSGMEITNALGEKVIVYNNDGLDDFVDDPNGFRNNERSYTMKKIKSNPNIKQYFKYNKEVGVGYLTYIDMETGKELRGDNITNIPILLLYPWSIDFGNDIVSTYIKEDYPVMYTTDPLPDDVMEDWKVIQERNQMDDNAEYDPDAINEPEEYDDYSRVNTDVTYEIDE